MSLTHGQNPHKHIWTFAEAIDESSHDYRHKCPCICSEHNSIIYPNSKLIIFAILHFPPTMMVAIMILFRVIPSGMAKDVAQVTRAALFQICVPTALHGSSSIYHHLHLTI